MTVFCEMCGSKIEDDALFCSICGTKVEQKTPVSKPTKALDTPARESPTSVPSRPLEPAVQETKNWQEPKKNYVASSADLGFDKPSPVAEPAYDQVVKEGTPTSSASGTKVQQFGSGSTMDAAGVNWDGSPIRSTETPRTSEYPIPQQSYWSPNITETKMYMNSHLNAVIIINYIIGGIIVLSGLLLLLLGLLGLFIIIFGVVHMAATSKLSLKNRTARNFIAVIQGFILFVSLPSFFIPGIAVAGYTFYVFFIHQPTKMFFGDTNPMVNQVMPYY